MGLFRFRVNEKRMRRKPYIVVRRAERVSWARGDSECLREFLLSPAGVKLSKICDDSIIAGVLPPDGNIVDPELVGAITAGKAEILEFIFAHAKLQRSADNGAVVAQDVEAVGADEEQSSAIQVDAE